MALSLAVASLLAAACVCPPAAPGAVVCGSDGLTYSSRCALGCARRQVPGLTVAQEGPCSQPAAALAGPPLEEFGKCRARCSKNYFKCVEEEGCDELSCMEPCFWKFHLECECACKRHLPAAPKVAEAPKVLALDAPRHANPRISRPDGLFSDEYNQAFDCWLNVTFDMSVCLVPCEPAQDEDCAMACVQTAMPLLCQCDLRDKDSSTTARPNTAPTGSVPPGSSPTGSPPTDDTAVAQTGTTPTTPGTLSTTESGNASPSLLSGVSIIVSSLVAIMIARF